MFDIPEISIPSKEQLEAHYRELIEKSNCSELAKRIIDVREGKIILDAEEGSFLLDQYYPNYKWSIPSFDGYVILFTFQRKELKPDDKIAEGDIVSYSFLPTEEQAAYNGQGPVTVVFAPVASVVLHDDNGQGKHPISSERQKVFLTIPNEQLGSPSFVSERIDAIMDPESAEMLKKNWSGDYFVGPFKECPDYVPLSEWIESKNKNISNYTSLRS